VKASRIILSLTVFVGVVAGSALPAFATGVGGGGGIQALTADTALDIGTIVQLDGKNSNHVKIATQAQLQNMFGVTVDRNQQPVTVSSDSATENNIAYVASSGTYNTLVSTQGGPIVAGDYVTLSAVDGVAMKASTDDKTVFGRAVGAFDGKGVTLGTTTLKDTTGKANKTVTLGMIPVTINIQRNPNIKSTKADLPQILQRLGQLIAEKTVSPVRIYLSMAITLISLVTAIAVVYAGVRNSIISIGRNPLSKKSIFRALLEIILTSFLILIIGLFAVYLLLRL